MTETDTALADELERLCSDYTATALPRPNRAISLAENVVINLPAILSALRHPAPRADDGLLIEAVAELQLAAFLAGRGSVTSMKHGTRSAKPAPSMDEFRNMARAALASEEQP